MRKLRFAMFILVVFFVVISTTTTPVSAVQNGEQAYLDQNLFQKNVKLSVFNNMSSKRTIQCFDVNEHGWFAVGYRVNEIHVYNENGIFQYGYHFSCDGDYGITLLSENIIIYFVRGDIIAEYDPDGQLISVNKTTFTQDILNKTIYKTSEKIGDTTYSLERDLGIFRGDYSRLVRTNGNDKREVLYDVTTVGYLFGCFHYLILISFPILLYIAISAAIKKEESSMEDGFE